MSLKRAALITGGTGGIGVAVAKRIAVLLDILVITGRKEEKLAGIKKQIEAASNVQVFTVQTELEEEESINKLADFILQKEIKLSYLIHCAGVIKTGNFKETTVPEFDSIFKINARAPFILSKALLPVLKANKGQIIFINSSVVRFSYRDKGLYAFSKIVLKGIADVLRQELNTDEIKVVSIFPGQTATTMQEKLYHDQNKTYLPELLIQPEDIAETVYNTLTLASTIEVTDVFIRPMKKNINQ